MIEEKLTVEISKEELQMLNYFLTASARESLQHFDNKNHLMFLGLRSKLIELEKGN
jgi:hypothetical protein